MEVFLMLDKLAMGMIGHALGGLVGGIFGDRNADKLDAKNGFASILAAARTEPTIADVAFGKEDAVAELRDITSGGIEGYVAWIIKQLREDVMESMGVTEEQIAAMDPMQREDTLKAIADEVERRMTLESVEDKEKMMALVNEARDLNTLEQFGELMRRIASKDAYKNRPEIV
jgi:hypothetical protein